MVGAKCSANVPCRVLIYTNEHLAMASQQQHQRTREMEMGFDSAQTIQYGYQDDHRSPSLTTGFLNRQQYQDLDEHAFVPTNHDFSSGGVHRPLYQEQGHRR